MKSKIIIFIIFIFIFLPTFVYTQQTEEWLKNIEEPEFSIDELQSDNLVSKYIKYDFSTLLSPHIEFYGFIGSNFERLHIYFTSISKDKTNDSVYNVKGISIAKNNKCDFNGQIIVEQIREYKKFHYGVDDEYKDKGIKSEGVMIGQYGFNEDKNQNNSGKFNGIITLYWYIDKYGIIRYDDIELSCSDRYCNNQYIGEWTNYKTGQRKTCNWGEYRIPFSSNLDMGTGEFSPDPKYYSHGWEDFNRGKPIK